MARKPRGAEYFFALGADDRWVESQQIDCSGFTGSRFRFGRLAFGGNVLKRLFGKNSTPYKAVQTPTSEIVLLGEPSGSGLQLLQAELAKILRGEGNTRKAYLSRIRYATEDRVRLAVLIDGRANASQMAAVIARGCQPLVPIDILFLESLSDEHREGLKQMKPFYVAD